MRSETLRIFRGALLASIGATTFACSSSSSDGDGSAPGDGGSGEAPSGGFVQLGPELPWHRPTTGECENHLPSTPAALPGDGGLCDARPYGHVVRVGQGLPPTPVSVCWYGCVRDSDCSEGQICRCGEPVGECATADCRTDGDCTAKGELCLETRMLAACGGPDSITFACGTAATECGSPNDCEPGQTRCAAGVCGLGAVCGRPFLVGGAPREASTIARGDWLVEVVPDVSSLEPAARAALARHYTTLARMEHASIAAFARFTLDLLSVGAPADLVTASAAALADETEHARLCFGLATAYGGAPVGPGPLDMTSALDGSSWPDLVVRTFLEGCVGETTAALEASEAARRAEEPTVTGILRRIADDELRHAQLAYRFVAWSLASAGPAQRDEMARRLEDALTRARTPGDPAAASGNEDPSLVAHGLLPGSVSRDVARDALSEIVAPCTAALLGGPPATLTEVRSRPLATPQPSPAPRAPA